MPGGRIGAAAPLEHDVLLSVHDVPPGERDLLGLGITRRNPPCDPLTGVNGA
jgi:hypothetical protein